MSNTTQLPEKVQTYNGPTSYRIAAGKICRGREQDNTLEVKPAILGYLRRVGVYSGTTQGGDSYTFLEADLDTRDGLVSVHTNVDSIVSSATFARGLMECVKDQLIQIEANQSSKANKHGTFSTYVNLFKVDPVTFKSTPVKPEKDDRDLESLLTEIQSHSAYKDRAPKEGSPDHVSEWEAFDAALKKRGWPTTSGPSQVYLEMCEKTAKRKFETLGHVDDETWRNMALGLEQAKAMPKKLAEWKPTEEEKYDPFADE